MLERVWRKGNTLTLLVGMQTSTAAMENSVEIPYAARHRLGREIASLNLQRVEAKPSAPRHPSVVFSRDPHFRGQGAFLVYGVTLLEEMRCRDP